MNTVRQLIAIAGLALPVACGGAAARAPDAAAVMAVADGPSDVTDGPDADGATAVKIGVTSDNCPRVIAAAAPAAAPPSQPIAVTATATDPDKTDLLTYAWTAASGRFAAPTAAATTYTCAAAGDQLLTVTASDGKCDDSSSSITITCLAGP